MDLAIVKFFCVARIPPTVADLDIWKDIFKIPLPSYVPASRTRLMDDHIMSEQEHVHQLQLEHLKTQRHISISFDGGSLRSGKSFYTVHATTVAQDMISLKDRMALASHTQVYGFQISYCK